MGAFSRFVLVSTLVLGSSCAASQHPQPWFEVGLVLPAPEEMLRVNGQFIETGTGERVVLQGVALGNEVYSGVELPHFHHNEEDYARVREMNMNSVRFYLHAATLEDEENPGQYKQSGWDWLDQNVAWAKEHGIYLVLNLHVPPGGYQSLGEGSALWEDPVTQERFIRLWREIAARYQGEPTIAGFDLLNEPIPTRSIQQWQELAERTIWAMREVNPHHMIFVERVNAVAGDWAENEDRNFFRVQDPNVVYEFHFYKPFHFTHQNASWTPYAAREAQYPDPAVAEVDWFFVKPKAVTSSPRVPQGDSGWTEYVTEPFLVEDEALAVGKPILFCEKNSGQVSFAELQLERVNERGQVEERLWQHKLDTQRGWYFWTRDGSGQVEQIPGQGQEPPALVISKTLVEANLGADPLRFIPQVGQRYQLRGKMKGKQVPAEARCEIQLEFYESRVPVQPRAKEYLRQELQAYLAWGEREQVPLYLGEFGTIRASFEEGRGGLNWVSDMLDLLLEEELHFAYHAYHEEWFALYYGDGALPDPEQANTALIELLQNKLAPEEARVPAAPGKTEPLRPGVTEPRAVQPEAAAPAAVE